MFFDAALIELVEDDPVEGIVEACNKAFRELNAIRDVTGTAFSEDEHELLWDVASFLNLALETNKFEIEKEMPKPSLNINNNCSALQDYIQSISDRFNEHAKDLKIESDINSYTSRYSTVFKTSFAYEFSDSDLSRVQELISQLRTHISENSSLGDSHRRRLLMKLEKLQSELHKRVSDLDVFWGLVGDAGVVLGKLGNDAKPIVDRIKEISQIIWNVQAKSEELPNNSSNPMLEQDDSPD